MATIEITATLKTGHKRPDTVFGPYVAANEDAARAWMKSFAQFIGDGASQAEFGAVGGKKNNVILAGSVTVDGKKKHTLTSESFDVPDAAVPVLESAAKTHAATYGQARKP